MLSKMKRVLYEDERERERKGEDGEKKQRCKEDEKKSTPTWPSNDNGPLIRAYPLFDALISLPRLPF